MLAKVAALTAKVAARDAAMVQAPRVRGGATSAHMLRGSEEARRPRWTNMGHTSPPSLTAYASYGEAFSSSHVAGAAQPPPPSFLSSDNKEARAMEEALRKS
jgi:hypothetical protein